MIITGRDYAATAPFTVAVVASRLHLDDDELATCVSCGLCLPHCPTFRVTGEEALSPRGRIAAMRAVQRRTAPDRRRLRALHGDVRAVPRLRAGVPERGAVRPPDGGHARRRWPSDHRITPAVAAARLRACSAIIAPLLAGIDACSPPPSGSAWCRRRAPALAASAAAPRSPAASTPTGDRRLAVHRLRDGRLAARHPPGHGGGARRHSAPRTARPGPAATAAARCTSTPGSPTEARAPGRAGDGRRCPATRRSSSTRPAAARR